MVNQKETLSDQIVHKALEFGASLAGIANIETLKKTPSHLISEKLPRFGGVGNKQVNGKKQRDVLWPENAKSAVVIGVEHPIGAQDDMDWWVKGLKGGTKGNRKLISVLSKLSEWLETKKHTPCIKIAYHIEHGGVFMKDTAVLAGLGCIGKNNLLLTPQFGPRIRLRVMLIDKDLSSTGILDFNPCADCKEYCRKACPQKAFNEKIYSIKDYKQKELPGRTSDYSRNQCNVQMGKDIAEGQEVVIEETGKKGHEVRFCRRCEQVCPAGRLKHEKR